MLLFGLFVQKLYDENADDLDMSYLYGCNPYTCSFFSR